MPNQLESYESFKIIITLEKLPKQNVPSYHGFNEGVLYFSLILGYDFPVISDKNT